MKSISNFEELVNLFSNTDTKKRVAIVCPDDECTFEVVNRCLANNLAILHIVIAAGHGSDDTINKLRALCLQHPQQAVLYESENVDEAARRAVKLVKDGIADVLMKGSINTDNLLRAILNKEEGLLPQGRVLTHLTVCEAPTYHKLLFVSDVAVIPRPTLDQFDAMLRYCVDTCHLLGIESPRAALIHFTEKTNPKFAHTLDYVTLKERAAAGEYGDTVVDGPMDVKTACDSHSGAIKGIVSPVVGNADILIFPILEAANTFYKTVSLFGKAKMAGIICGASAPIVVSSRADSAESKFLSLALACTIS